MQWLVVGWLFLWDRWHVYGDRDWPCVDAVLAAKGVFHGEASVVKLQGREASLVQAHHLSVGQRQSRAVGVVAWTGVWGRHCVGCGINEVICDPQSNLEFQSQGLVEHNTIKHFLTVNSIVSKQTKKLHAGIFIDHILPSIYSYSQKCCFMTTSVEHHQWVSQAHSPVRASSKTNSCK